MFFVLTSNQLVRKARTVLNHKVIKIMENYTKSYKNMVRSVQVDTRVMHKFLKICSQSGALEKLNLKNLLHYSSNFAKYQPHSNLIANILNYLLITNINSIPVHWFLIKIKFRNNLYTQTQYTVFDVVQCQIILYAVNLKENIE